MENYFDEFILNSTLYSFSWTTIITFRILNLSPRFTSKIFMRTERRTEISNKRLFFQTHKKNPSPVAAGENKSFYRFKIFCC